MLDVATFKTVVDSTPLVSIDLVVQDLAGNVLLGLRKNRPAQGFWFVPGGRIRKGESLDAAFARISRVELGLEIERGSAYFLGVYEHFYEDSVFGVSPQHPTTHYIVLAYRLTLPNEVSFSPPFDQHDRYRWQPTAAIFDAVDVHPHTQAYFRE